MTEEETWYAFWPRWPLRRRCWRALRPRRRPGFAAQPASAPADGRAAATWSMPRFGRSVAASAAARCRCARSCAAGPEAEHDPEKLQTFRIRNPGLAPGVFILRTRPRAPP